MAVVDVGGVMDVSDVTTVNEELGSTTIARVTSDRGKVSRHSVEN